VNFLKALEILGYCVLPHITNSQLDATTNEFPVSEKPNARNSHGPSLETKVLLSLGGPEINMD
jgi:hypothetical protein